MKSKIVCFFWVAVILSASGCYLLKQAKGQLEVCFGQVPLNEAIAGENDSELRSLLTIVPDIKEFAVKKLLLKRNDGYSSYFATENKGVVFVVTAASKNELKPFVWSFPFLGEVPYKGFFEERDALTLESELKSEGYDTWTFTASAYSTLGWFKDPITTPMLRNGLYFLTETIIHEMTHASFYAKGQGEFNEQLASFTGRKGAFQYFLENKSLTSEQLRRIRERLDRRAKTAEIVRQYIPELESLYRKNYPLTITLEKREAVFLRIAEEILKIYPQTDAKFRRFNNARILQYRRYKSDDAIFRNFWEKGGQSWDGFWKLVRQYAAERKWSIVSY